MPISQFQKNIGEILSKHLGGFERLENIRPEWMESQKGERLELDFYYPELFVAFEVQGQQHYVYTPHFHPTYWHFEEQQRRDEEKRQICNRSGITLYEVASEFDLENMLSEIKDILPNSRFHAVYEWTEKIQFIFSHTRKRRKVLGDTFKKIQGLTKRIGKYAEQGRLPPYSLPKQLSCAQQLYTCQQIALAKRTIESSVYFDTVIVPKYQLLKDKSEVTDVSS